MKKENNSILNSLKKFGIWTIILEPFIFLIQQAIDLYGESIPIPENSIIFPLFKIFPPVIDILSLIFKRIMKEIELQLNNTKIKFRKGKGFSFEIKNKDDLIINKIYMFINKKYVNRIITFTVGINNKIKITIIKYIKYLRMQIDKLSTITVRIKNFIIRNFVILKYSIIIAITSSTISCEFHSKDSIVVFLRKKYDPRCIEEKARKSILLRQKKICMKLKFKTMKNITIRKDLNTKSLINYNLTEAIVDSITAYIFFINRDQLKFPICISLVRGP